MVNRDRDSDTDSDLDSDLDGDLDGDEYGNGDYISANPTTTMERPERDDEVLQAGRNHWVRALEMDGRIV